MVSSSSILRSVSRAVSRITPAYPVSAANGENCAALIAEIAQNPEDGERVLDVLMIAKYLERIGDHATNIAEWVEFSITGSHKSAMHGAEAAAR